MRSYVKTGAVTLKDIPLDFEARITTGWGIEGNGLVVGRGAVVDLQPLDNISRAIRPSWRAKLEPQAAMNAFMTKCKMVSSFLLKRSISWAWLYWVSSRLAEPTARDASAFRQCDSQLNLGGSTNHPWDRSIVSQYLFNGSRNGDGCHESHYNLDGAPAGSLPLLIRILPVLCPAIITPHKKTRDQILSIYV